MFLKYYFLSVFLAVWGCINILGQQKSTALSINDLEYFAMAGLNVMVFQDIYPEGHQGGIGIIQNGERVATNGDLRLEPAPGQWSPTPVLHSRVVSKAENTITVSLSFPDSSRNRRGFNPIDYPDLYFTYKVRVISKGSSIHVLVDLDKPLPKEWAERVGFNLELYPTVLFGKGWYMDQQSGIFPRQPNGPAQFDTQRHLQPLPVAIGKRLVIAPESDAQRMVIESRKAPLQLIDGRMNHNNGWFVVRALVAEGTTQGAVDWVITPNAIPGWIYKPVIHVSQIGYHPKQQKIAIIELDASDKASATAKLMRISESSVPVQVYSFSPKFWGKFMRYNYLQFDFTSVEQEGLYFIQYGDSQTNVFRISSSIYKDDVWQPVLEYFLPIQMCHMRVNEKYKVWHGLCHMDDALMAPTDHNHFDGYAQGSSTLTRFKPMDPVPGLNKGGWHDAGDDDLRVESQSGEAYILSLMYEAFKLNYDNTTISQEERHVEIHQPDGKPDLLQQIENGAITVVNGYKSLGRLYRGIISPTLHQYTLMGDVSNQTDNKVYDPKQPGTSDDRWVFTENSPRREVATGANLAAIARALKGYNDTLASECLTMAEELWNNHPDAEGLTPFKVQAAIELLLTTRKDIYRQFILDHENTVATNIPMLGWQIGRAIPLINNDKFTALVRKAVADYAGKIESTKKGNPFGIPYKPVIWGAGWNIQKFGVDMYFLHQSFPDLVSKDYVFSVLNFILGCHPGENTASFASGVGAKSVTRAYGYNRADWSYIPGGVVSGTALIRPDFPELKEFPFLWQQTEYVLGGGSSNYMFLVLAADQLLNRGVLK
jgi:hypothetical protein